MEVKLSLKKHPQCGLTPLITWAVIDPVMRAVITKTQDSFSVETRASALRLAIEMMLDAGLELRI